MMKYFGIIFLISISTSIIKGQELSIFQGVWGPQYYEDDRKISKSEFKDKIYAQPESMNYWKKYQSNITISGISGLVGTGGLVWWIRQDEGQSKTAPIILTIGGFGIGAIFDGIARKHQKEAILSYNRNASIGFHVTPSREGIGLTMHF